MILANLKFGDLLFFPKNCPICSSLISIQIGYEQSTKSIIDWDKQKIHMQWVGRQHYANFKENKIASFKQEISFNTKFVSFYQNWLSSKFSEPPYIFEICCKGHYKAYYSIYRAGNFIKDWNITLNESLFFFHDNGLKKYGLFRTSNTQLSELHLYNAVDLNKYHNGFNIYLNNGATYFQTASKISLGELSRENFLKINSINKINEILLFS